MCENTLGAMNQLINAMNEEGPRFLAELSRTERRSFQELFNACEKFMITAEELTAERDEIHYNTME